MVQYALPDANGLALVGWTESAGDGDGDCFDELDEGFGAGRGSGSGPDDATTYWESTAEGAGNFLHTQLEDVTDPVIHTGHKYRGRNRKDSANGRQIDLTIRLDQQLVTKASQTFTNIDNVWTTREDTLSEAEAGTISNYTQLQFRTSVLEVGGGSPREGWESAHEFECPDAGGPSYYHGLKVQGEGELALCDVGSHPLRIRKGGTTYGIELVETNDPNASRVRIKTPAGIKAIRKYT